MLVHKQHKPQQACLCDVGLAWTVGWLGDTVVPGSHGLRICSHSQLLANGTIHRPQRPSQRPATCVPRSRLDRFQTAAPSSSPSSTCAALQYITRATPASGHSLSHFTCSVHTFRHCVQQRQVVRARVPGPPGLHHAVHVTPHFRCHHLDAPGPDREGGEPARGAQGQMVIPLAARRCGRRR